MTFSGLDTGLIVVLILLSFIGLIRGFLKELSSMVDWIGSFYLTAISKPLILPMVEKKVTLPLLPDIVANIILFIGYMIILSILMNIIANSIRRILPASTNTFLGFVFGCLKGIIVIALILSSMDIINKNSRKKFESIEKSVLYNCFSEFSSQMFGDEIESILGEFLKEIKKNKKNMENELKEKVDSIRDTIKDGNEDMERLLNILVD